MSTTNTADVIAKNAEKLALLQAEQQVPYLFRRLRHHTPVFPVLPPREHSSRVEVAGEGATIAKHVSVDNTYIYARTDC
jgi:hypothetical protein